MAEVSPSRVCPTCGAEVGAGARFCPACGGPVPEAAQAGGDDAYLGRTLAQKFYIQELIGTGGMGKVYRAQHLSLDKPICIKVLRKSLLDDPSIVARFQREARASSRLNHPNSIQVIDFGQAEDGALYIAMEYLAGRDLQKVLVQEFPLAEARICHIMAQVCSALADAHAAGIIHRDLKPENIMLTPRRDDADAVKVLDFGIAKIQDPTGGEGGPALTRAGLVCGTPEYMSPEQARGAQLDPRSDVYAIGVILYQLTTGVLPFDADSPIAMVTKHLTLDPPPPSQRRPGVTLGEPMERLILRCLSKDPAGRPASAEELRRELLAIGGIPTPAFIPRTTPPRTQVFATPSGTVPTAASGTLPAAPRGMTDLGVLPPAPDPLRASTDGSLPVPAMPEAPVAPAQPLRLGVASQVKPGRSPLVPALIAVVVVGGGIGGAYAAGLFGGKEPPPASAPAPAAAVNPTPAPAPAPSPAPGPAPGLTGNPAACQPSSACYHTEIAKQAFARGDMDGTIEASTRALKLDGKWVEAYKVMGMAYQAKGDPYRAVKAFKDYVRIAPYNADVPAVKELIANMGG